jgi:Raf kinase inhibitor-like YbhB/YbcL family protein
MRLIAYALPAALLATSALAAPAKLDVKVDGITENQPIAEKYALCKPTKDGKSENGDNKRPTISWSGAPEGTKSYAVIVQDPDVPASFTKTGKDGEVIGAEEKRQDFYHWALLDIPADKKEIDGGRSSRAPKFGTPANNDLGSYLSDTHNYGGPCPPWNDERVHHYHFKVYALDTEKLELPKDATAKQADKALMKSPHVLARGAVTGTYTLNAKLRKEQ